jgi:hypothetical protein
MKLKKLLVVVSFSLLINSSNAETIKPQSIIKFFNICTIKSSLGQMCKIDSFNSYEYFKGLDEVIKDNKALYKEGDFWEFYFTIEEQTDKQAIITFEDLALRGTYKSIETLIFKKDNDNWKLYSIKNVYPNNEKEFKIISD